MTGPIYGHFTSVGSRTEPEKVALGPGPPEGENT